MKQKFRLFRRGKVYWCHDNESGKQQTLGTRSKPEAQRLLHAKNEAHHLPRFNLQIARAYLTASDPEYATRTWQYCMDQIVALKHGPTRVRWDRATREKAITLKSADDVEKMLDACLAEATRQVTGH